MYIDTSKIRSKNGKVYIRHLLRRCYREDGKIKHETIANLSHCSEAEVQAMKLALKHKQDLTKLGSKEEITTRKGKSIGAIWLLLSMAKRLGIQEALGNSKQGKLALWQIFARVIEQGSRLSSVRLAERQTYEILGLSNFNENDLYKNLDWLHEQQTRIEDELYKRNKGDSTLFLYDVTSSYFEGVCNELAEYGYNRDGKRNKLQIVIGLLCNGEGIPLSIEVFEGNARDHNTLKNQITKAANRFGVKKVTFVGDRGMIKSLQVEALGEQDFNYITAITKPQIETLLNKDCIQLDLFDNNLAEVTNEGIRYVLRRNPVRKEEIQESRLDKLNNLQLLVAARNKYLKEHPRAKIKTAINVAERYAKKIKIANWANIVISDNELKVVVNEELLKEEAILDGCYVIKTDLSQEEVSKETIHNCYKDLALVEQAFRSSKTVNLELRPIYVRLAERTRGHVFVIMLAYRIVKELSRYWRQLDITVEEGISALSELCQIEIKIDGQRYNHIPKPDALTAQLLSLANVTLPEVLPKANNNVTTKRKLSERRKFQ